MLIKKFINSWFILFQLYFNYYWVHTNNSQIHWGYRWVKWVFLGGLFLSTYHSRMQNVQGSHLSFNIFSILQHRVFINQVMKWINFLSVEYMAALIVILWGGETSTKYCVSSVILDRIIHSFSFNQEEYAIG